LLAPLLVLALIDTALGYRTIARDLSHAGPPTALDPREAQLISTLRSLPPGRLTLVRECRQTVDFPDVEYAISVLTQHAIPIGHVQFTPDLVRREVPFLVCNQTPARLSALFRTNRYLVMDRGVAARLGIAPVTPAGRWDLAATPETVRGGGNGP
jgi:hypothetical protein